MALDNLILGTNKPTDWLELHNDYVDYAQDLNHELKDKSRIDLGYSSRDLDLMGKYNIDITTHLENLFRTKEYMKTIEYKKIYLK